MAIREIDHLEALERLKQLAKRIRELVDESSTGELGEATRLLADKLADDAKKLETRLVELGYISKPANEP